MPVTRFFERDLFATKFRKGARRRARADKRTELIVDNFAGGGGASTGIEEAMLELGKPRCVDIAINHDESAIQTHEYNHPDTRHYRDSVWRVDPVALCDGQPVGLAWFSPDCRHFSRAKGKKPVSRKIRCLAWVVVRWARLKKPRLIMLENVREFLDWGPLMTLRDAKGRPILDDNGKEQLVPDPERKGESFKRWHNELRRYGYTVEYRVLNAADYGAPTHRRRLFVIARRDGKKIKWPVPTHGPGRAHPYRTAAECIDWSIPCPSIFDRKRDLKGKACLRKKKHGCKGKYELAGETLTCNRCRHKSPRYIEKPLADKTLRRIALGIKRYVLDSPKPFIVPVTHAGERRNHDIDEPLPTVTAAHRGEMALVTPHITTYYGTNKESNEFRGNAADEPLRTQTVENRHGVVAASLARIGQTGGNGAYAYHPEEPLTTITSKAEHLLTSATLIGVGGATYSAKPKPVDGPKNTVLPNDRTALVSALLTKHYGGPRPQVASPVDEPIGTITQCDHHSLTTAQLVKMYGTNTGQDIETPLHTVTSGGFKFGLVYAFMCKYFGTAIGTPMDEPMHTVTSKPRFGLVTVKIDDTVYAIADIGMRMLQPHELAKAQGFPDTYVLVGSKSNQVAKIGNSVPPQLAKALVKANW